MSLTLLVSLTLLLCTGEMTLSGLELAFWGPISNTWGGYYYCGTGEKVAVLGVTYNLREAYLGLEYIGGGGGGL